MSVHGMVEWMTSVFPPSYMKVCLLWRKLMAGRRVLALGPVLCLAQLPGQCLQGPDDGGPSAVNPLFGMDELSAADFEDVEPAPIILQRPGGRRVELSPFFPPAGDQGPQASCVGWAVGYALKTYHEAIERQWNPEDVRNQFSPAFIYGRSAEGVCDEGMTFLAAFTTLRFTGCMKYADAPYDPTQCSQVGPRDLCDIAPYRIENWQRIPGTGERQRDQVCAQLDARKPVLLGIRAFQPFVGLKGRDATYDTIGLKPSLGNHAVIGAGYDDDRGAIRILNSFGSDWGDDGFAWLSYSIWDKVVVEAYVTTDFIEEGELPPDTPFNQLLIEGPGQVFGGTTAAYKAFVILQDFSMRNVTSGVTFSASDGRFRGNLYTAPPAGPDQVTIRAGLQVDQEVVERAVLVQLTPDCNSNGQGGEAQPHRSPRRQRAGEEIGPRNVNRDFILSFAVPTRA